jgi:3,4-dihydroxy-2-butanone 4-phosphate synthase
MNDIPVLTSLWCHAAFSFFLLRECMYACDHSIAANKFVLVMDNEDRENEGDLIIAAEKVTTEQMAFLIKYSR